jgi:tRNA1(Val) A37 N6-methylase TrmN6
MGKKLFKNAVCISHNIISQVLKQGDIAVDATCGRGNDTLFIAGLVGEKGKIYGFDIQKEAIESTRVLLKSNNLADQVILINDDNRKMASYIDERPGVIMFNLGYLPDGDHRIKTNGDTTVEALKAAINLLDDEGIITIVIYPGHAGGLEELTAVETYLAGLSQRFFEVSEIRFINQINSPPQIIIVQKILGGAK